MTFIEYHVAKHRDVSSFPMEIWIFSRICERTSAFYERQPRENGDALRLELLTQPSSAILADATASETVECSELRAGVSCLSFLPLHLPSPFVFLFASFPVRSISPRRLSRAALAVSISHTHPLVPRYIDLSLRLSPSSSTATFFRPHLLRFAPAPSLSGSHYLLITSYLVTCYPFARRSILLRANRMHASVLTRTF